MSECQHYWTTYGERGWITYDEEAEKQGCEFLLDRCERCGETRERPPTPEERELFELEDALRHPDRLAYKVELEIAKHLPKTRDEWCDEEKVNDAVHALLKSEGRMGDMLSASYDNSTHEMSHAEFIPVESAYHFMGVHVTYYAQHGTPSTFFLYPEHMDRWIETLISARNRARLKHRMTDRPLRSSQRQLIPGNLPEERRQKHWEEVKGHMKHLRERVVDEFQKELADKKAAAEKESANDE